MHVIPSSNVWCWWCRILTKRRLRLLDLVQDDSISREAMTEFCFTLRKHANDLAPLMQRHVPTPSSTSILPPSRTDATIILCLQGSRSSGPTALVSTTTATFVCPGTSPHDPRNTFAA